MAYQEYELRIYDLPVTLLSCVLRMCEICMAIGSATYVLQIFKCTHKKSSTSAYEEYELGIEEYELRMLTYL